MGLSMAERRAVTREMAIRYTRAGKKERGVILDELCALTCWTRRHARRRLSQVLLAGQLPARRPPVRPRTYDDEVLGTLRTIWAMLGGPCGKRLAPFLTEMVQVLERCDELSLAPAARNKLCGISASTIDRALAPERHRLGVKGRSGTKPGSMLKSQIPIRTFSEWNENAPGFFEMDLVAHDGGVAAGEYCQTLDITDVFSGWTEMGAVPNKAQRWVHEELKAIRLRLPFELAGLDSDNGGEFINDQMLRWCIANKITFTRSRPYRKNDNCFVEQKNWTHVRQAVGYARYDTPTELKILRELYGVLRLQLNFFSPQMRLVSKSREGSKVTKRYDVARTPYQRLMQSEHLDARQKRALRRQYMQLNPAELSREIGRIQRKLMAATARKAANKRKEVKPVPGPSSRTFPVRQRRVATRTS